MAATTDWPGYGGGADEQHYSPLRSIDDKNVGRLALAWWQDLPVGTTITQPIEAQGRVFTATGHSLISAFDAVTGKLLWRYDTKAAENSGYKLRESWGSRGLAYADGRVFAATYDGRLMALAAETGNPVWSVATTQPGDLRFITGAPRVFAGKVIIGHGGSDSGNARGYVTCYDAKTGRLLWRFYTVPGDPAKGPDGAASDSIMPMATKTWYGTWWKNGAGGATAWNAMTYDPDFNRIYIGTGNGSAYNQVIRSKGRGDNLFVASIIAVDADSGKYAWHYQVNPGDEWDYDACYDLTLATLTIGGKPRKVLMQASKNGFFYVLDRAGGKLISAAPFAKVSWASGIDVSTGRPMENPSARYHGHGSVEMWPSMTGAHTWPPQSFSPMSGLVYIPVIERGMIISDQAVDLTNWNPPVHALGGPGVIGNIFADLPGSRRSFLKAWDPVAQSLRWSHELPGDWPAGTMATAGNLVFQGRIDRKFVAYAADTGVALWTFDARSPIVAPPMTYAIDGRQYVTVLTGNGGSGGGIGAVNLVKYASEYYSMPRRVLTFALDGAAELPPPVPPPDLHAPDDPTYRANQALEERGFAQFHTACAVCHGMEAIGGGGAAPDLRVAAPPRDQASFETIVRGGALVSQGMPQFEDLSADDVEAIRQYIRSRGQALPKPDSTAGR
jgi:quinohemoprotein ethanol dehydrogenase